MNSRRRILINPRTLALNTLLLEGAKSGTVIQGRGGLITADMRMQDEVTAPLCGLNGFQIAALRIV
jgi:hypothetical protein